MKLLGVLAAMVIGTCAFGQAFSTFGNNFKDREGRVQSGAVYTPPGAIDGGPTDLEASEFNRPEISTDAMERRRILVVLGLLLIVGGGTATGVYVWRRRQAEAY